MAGRREDGPVRRHASASGAGYTWFVRMAKVLLPVVALVMIGLVISRLSQDPLQGVQNIPEHEKTEPGQIELVAARYEGVDEEGRPYALIAEKAVRDPASPDRVLLEKLQADVALEDKSWIAVHAEKGSYDTQTKNVALSGNVTVFHDRGYEMQLQDITIDTVARSARTDNPVTAQGGIGRIAAAGMEVRDAGARILFTGPATLTLHRLGG